jgi:hypothetical protein
MPLTDECEWFERCDRPAAGHAAHPFHGVIPVCQSHVDAYAIPLITRNTQTQES